MKRKPLAVGNIYIFPGCPTNGFKVKFINFPNTPGYDGGMPGVTLEWFGNEKTAYLYPFNNEKDFWDDLLFKSAVSK